MIVNIERFKQVLLKATLNYSTDTVGFGVDPDNIRVGMRGDNFVIVLNMPNDLIPDIKGDCEFCFSEPSNQVRTHLDLLSGNEDVEINISDNNIILKSGSQRSVVHFCSPNLVPTFSGAGPKKTGTSIYQVKLDDDWMYKLDKIQKIASKFKKIYFVVKDKMVSIDCTDKLNNYSNGMSLSLGDCDHDDVTICVDFKSFANAFRVLGDNYEDFIMTVSVYEGMGAGLISLINDDESEKYYVLSREDTES